MAGIDEGLVGRRRDFESVKKNRTRREEPRMKPRVREGEVEGHEWCNSERLVKRKTARKTLGFTMRRVQVV